MKDQIIIKDSVKRLGFENWPAGSPIWVRITPDGSSALGWRSSAYEGTSAKALRAEADACAIAFAKMQVGDTMAVPVGYHPRHGKRQETWTRVL